MKDSIRKRARIKKTVRNRYIPAAIRKAIIANANNRCQHCSRLGDLNHWQGGFRFHHIKPWADGGEHSLGNLLALCIDCHKKVHASTALPKPTQATSKDPLRAIWYGMRSRCSNPNHSQYHNYGGRGIKVCKRWDDFENFAEDMGPRPSPSHSLDRINVNKNYSPKNCRWATQKEQCNNRRPRLVITWKGETKTVKQWSEATGISESLLWRRIRIQKWTVERALSTPPRGLSPWEQLQERIAKGEVC